MKVKELIQRLAQFDPEALVIVNGYEGGLCEIAGCRQLKIKLNVNTAWYYGPHEETDDLEEGVDAVQLA